MVWPTIALLLGISQSLWWNPDKFLLSASQIQCYPAKRNGNCEIVYYCFWAFLRHTYPCRHHSEIGHITAEKQTPGPLQYLADFQSAIDLERRMASGPARPLKDLLTKCTAEYNKLCSSKKHRVDSARKSLIYNMLLDYFDVFFKPLKLNLFVVITYRMGLRMGNF